MPDASCANAGETGNTASIKTQQIFMKRSRIGRQKITDTLDGSQMQHLPRLSFGVLQTVVRMVPTIFLSFGQRAVKASGPLLGAWPHPHSGAADGANHEVVRGVVLACLSNVGDVARCLRPQARLIKRYCITWPSHS